MRKKARKKGKACPRGLAIYLADVVPAIGRQNQRIPEGAPHRRVAQRSRGKATEAGGRAGGVPPTPFLLTHAGPRHRTKPTNNNTYNKIIIKGTTPAGEGQRSLSLPINLSASLLPMFRDGSSVHLAEFVRSFAACLPAATSFFSPSGPRKRPALSRRPRGRTRGPLLPKLLLGSKRGGDP